MKSIVLILMICAPRIDCVPHPYNGEKFRTLAACYEFYELTYKAERGNSYGMHLRAYCANAKIEWGSD